MVKAAEKQGGLLTIAELSVILNKSYEVTRKYITVRTVIVDEIHTLAGDKRGVHLSLSLERLQHVAGQPIQRIGLSATIRPLDEVARFLGGYQISPLVGDPPARWGSVTPDPTWQKNKLPASRPSIPQKF